MSAKTSSELDPATRARIDEQMREYQAMRERQYDDAMARLESVEIEPASQAAYAATLAEMSALSLSEVVWPDDSPRYDLHHAMGYGDKLTARRSEVEQRFRGRVPLEQVFDINRYALAALHAFKHWRSNPEPADSFAKLLSQAASKRRLLRSCSAVLVSYKHLRTDKLRHFEGGITPESIGCDLILLAGVLREAIPRLNFELIETADLMEAELIANGLLRHAAGGSNPDLWEPTQLYARAFTLVDRATFHAELVLSEFHNEERDPYQEMVWTPGCLFCECSIERQRHHRHSESLQQTRERAQFVTSTMTTVLRRSVIGN